MNRTSYEEKMNVIFQFIKMRSKIKDINHASIVLSSCLEETIPLIPSCVEVKKSPIHGKGVFAIIKIMKGDVITRYPCDIILYKKGELVWKHQKKSTKSTHYNEMDYASVLRTEGDTTIYCAGDPAIYSSIACGHMINDVCLNISELEQLTPDDTAETLTQKTMENIIRSSSANSQIINNKYYAYIIALKDIDIGEEITTSYDITYWTKNISGESLIERVLKHITTMEPKKRNFYMNLMKNYMQRGM
jgi:SET domain-containing protein